MMSGGNGKVSGGGINEEVEKNHERETDRQREKERE